MPNIIEEGRIGTILIPKEWYTKRPEHVMKVLSRFLAWETKYNFPTDCMETKAWSSLFNSVQEGCMPYYYGRVHCEESFEHKHKAYRYYFLKELGVPGTEKDIVQIYEPTPKKKDKK